MRGKICLMGVKMSEEFKNHLIETIKCIEDLQKNMKEASPFLKNLLNASGFTHNDFNNLDLRLNNLHKEFNDGLQSYSKSTE